jgi:hypothetical protein
MEAGQAPGGEAMQADRHITAVNPETGQSLTWAQAGTWRAVFFGEPSLAAAANELCYGGETVALSPGGPSVVADRNDPRAVVAVLQRVCGPGATITGDTVFADVDPLLSARSIAS